MRDDVTEGASMAAAGSAHDGSNFLRHTETSAIQPITLESADPGCEVIAMIQRTNEAQFAVMGALANIKTKTGWWDQKTQ